MAQFISIVIDETKCVGPKECGKCIKVCPVNIFEGNGDVPAIDTEQEDECLLCNLCADACNFSAIAFQKMYEVESTRGKKSTKDSAEYRR